jgi:RHS repeat-associated protein
VTKYFYDTDSGRADPQNPSLRLGRLTAVEYYVTATATTPTETVQYRYDAEGRRDKVLDSVAGTTDYDYDAEGRLLRVQGPSGLAQTLNYSYDAATGRLTRTWTDKSDIQYVYDKLGRLQTLTLVQRNGAVLANAEQTQYGFDLAGNLTTITQRVGTVVVHTATLGYDALNRLTSRVNRDGANNTLSSFSYTRRADGQITGLTETVQQPLGPDVTTTAVYTYDALNRLVREVVDTAGTADDYTTDYTLDLVGNRIRRLTTKGSGVVERVEGTFDVRDRLTQEQFYDAATGGTLTNTLTYGYDANGSLTTRTTTTGASLTQVWDVRGRLQSATDVQGGTTRQALYGYDPDGLRLREQVTTTTGMTSTTDVRLLVVDHLSPAGYAEVIEERTESSEPLLVASYVYGAGLDPISVFRVGQPAGLYVPDGHSGVRQVVDLAVVAAVLAAYRYDTFGNKVATAGTFSDVIGYRGGRLDSVLGQHYFLARMYDPRNGRFTALDPFFGSLENPLSLHKYLYTHGDPVNRIDPSGRLATLGGFILGGGLFGTLGGLGAYYANTPKAQQTFGGYAGSAVGGLALGVALGALSFYSPGAGLALAALGVVLSTIDAINVLFFRNDLTWDQKGVSVFLAALSVFGAYKARQRYLLFDDFGQGWWVSRNLRFPTDSTAEVSFSSPRARALQIPSEPFRTVRPGETTLPTDMQISVGGRFNVPANTSPSSPFKGLFVVDRFGYLRIARGDVGHPRLTGGDTHRIAGEFRFNSPNAVRVNARTGRGQRASELARDFFRALGYFVTIDESLAGSLAQ